ncbi:MAG: hypothetical protein VX642_06775 [Bdellovibrionota bacterium]|nr:hypothetical protein [Bdellovibrionota bacterium]
MLVLQNFGRFFFISLFLLEGTRAFAVVKKPYEVRFSENKLSAEFDLFDQNILQQFEAFLKKEKVQVDKSNTSWSRTNRLWQESRIDVDFAKVENEQSEALSGLKLQMSKLQFVLFYNSKKHPKAESSKYFLNNSDMKTATILGVRYLKDFDIKDSAVSFVENPIQIFKMLKYSRIDYFLAPVNAAKLFKAKPEYKFLELGEKGSIPTYIYFHKDFISKYKDFAELLAKNIRLWACGDSNLSKPDYCEAAE